MLELAIALLVSYFPEDVARDGAYYTCEVMIENDFQDGNEIKVKDACLYIVGVSDEF